mgnify:CR=1 FL=1
MVKHAAVPQHIGYILDGNRRWAKKHGLPTYEGHLAGVNALEEVIRESIEQGVKYISFYTWSTENWSRAEVEVSGIMKLVRMLFKRELKKLIKEGCRLLVMGSREQVPDDILAMIDKAEAESRGGTRATLIMCFNYGGQQEIVRAAQRIAAAGVDPAELDVEGFANYLDHPDIPPCDLIVRTSGEQRLSNFMLWRSAYSEFIFLEKLWPDMRKEDVTGIIEEYNNRSRRYGA